MKLAAFTVRAAAVLALSDIHASEVRKLGKMGEPLKLTNAFSEAAGGDEAVEFH